MTEPPRAHHLQNNRLIAWAGSAAIVLAVGGALIWRANTPQATPEVAFVGEADIRSKFSLTDHMVECAPRSGQVGRV